MTAVVMQLFNPGRNVAGTRRACAHAGGALGVPPSVGGRLSKWGNEPRPGRCSSVAMPKCG